MKKITEVQLKSLRVSPIDIASAIHALCPKTTSGKHKYSKRKEFTGKWSKDRICEYCGRHQV